MSRFVIGLSLIIFIIPQIQCQSESAEQTAMEQIFLIDANSSTFTIPSVSLDSSSTTVITESSETAVSSTTAIITESSESTDSSTTSIITESSESTDSSTTSISTEPTDSSSTSISTEPTDSSTTSIITESSESTDSSTTSISTEPTDSSTTSISTESTDSSTTSISTEPTDFSTTSITMESEGSSTSPIETTSSDITVSTKDTTTTEPITSKSSSSETSSDTTEESKSTSISTTNTPTTTTQPPPISIFNCTFTTPCFGEGELNITDGIEYNPSSIDHDTLPPRAPFSDVTSILEPTNDGYKCAFPYPPQVANPPNWNMSFCYKDHCLTEKPENATCAPGSYGLLALTASESSKTVSQSIDSSGSFWGASNTHKLQFYYYFTVFPNGTNWGQQIQIWIQSDTTMDNSFSLGNLTVDNMKDYRWQSKSFTYSPPSNIYTLKFIFRIDAANSADYSPSDEPIYFALDNIEISKRDEPSTTSTTTTSSPTTTTTTADTGTRPPDSESDLAMILGLSLGIGIPVLCILIGGSILYRKRNRRRYRNAYDIPLTSTRPRTNSDIFSNPYLF